MRKFIKYPRYTIVLCAIFFSVFILTKCINSNINNDLSSSKITFSQFAGNDACINCHKNIYESYSHTAHYLTSQPTSAKYLKGSFESGRNVFAYDNNTGIVMEKSDSGFFQAAYYNGTQQEVWRMDITVGSGTMGQSFLSWKNNSLFQLPITFFTRANQWSNSTGVQDKILLNRTITARCLECHNTFAKVISSPGTIPEEFDHTQIIYGVGCEKCHGPAAQHVKFQTQNPTEKQGKYIFNPVKFSRQQKLDMCILCHGGRLQKIKPSFEFTPGDTLSNYFSIDNTSADPANIDVHGNQYGLLRLSKCFRESRSLTCNTCHGSHENEKDNIALFSQRCINCHNSPAEKTCKLTHTIGAAINQNCIDCHMPLKSSNVVTVFLPHSNGPTSALIRSHYIAIYPDEAKKIIAVMKGMPD